MSGGAASRLVLTECPAFAGLERGSLTYAFEIKPEEEPGDDVAFRVSAVHKAIFGAQPRLPDPQLGRARKLFEASASFIDDITTGIPGVNGRPLMLAATTQGPNHDDRRCIIRRPEEWHYDYEGAGVSLAVPLARRNLETVIQDHFCVFESGRIFYILVFSHTGEDDCPFDEYSLIHMLQLVHDEEKATNGDKDPVTGKCRKPYLFFSQGILPLSLIEFARQRLEAIDREGSEADGGFALGDVLRPFGILPASHTPLSVSAPCNAMVQIEDQEMFRVARYAYGHYRIDNQTPEAIRAAAFAEPAAAADAEEHPEALWTLHKAWHSQGCALADGGPPMHDAAGFEEGEAFKPIPRHILAFAGLVQRVPDFPRQDESEVHDSTRPVSIALENLFYVHPAFEFEVGINWRTFRQGQADIGGCPYALLTWLIVVHDELLVTEMEDLIQNMLFSPPEPEDAPDQLGRTIPAHGLGRLLARVANPFPARDCSLDDNLRSRLTIFRRCTIHQSGNVFRYPTERGVLDDVRAARGTKARFDDALALIDRYENLVEDVASLAAGYASSRANLLLALLAMLGALALPKTLSEAAGLFGYDINLAGWTFGILGLIGAALLSWLLVQLSRSRNSS